MAEKKDYVQLVCDATESSYETAEKEMESTKEVFGITYREYYNNRLFELSDTQRSIEARRIVIRRKHKKERYDKVIAATNLSEKQIREKIREINRKYGIKITILLYQKYEIYRYEGETLEDFLKLFAERNRLKEQLSADFNKIDAKRLTYQEIAPELERFYHIIDAIMPESLFEELKNRIALSYPEVLKDTVKARKIAVDMEAVRVLLGFSAEEYANLNFADKSFEEKRDFFSEKERFEVINRMNDPVKADLLDDKYEAYKLLGKYYGRRMIKVSSKKDYKSFRSICRRGSKIVVKPFSGTMGKGVKNVDIKWWTDIRKLFENLLGEYNVFIVEELIKAHHTLSALNPDSVNTVRLLTYADGNKKLIHDPTIKIGQKGSFVDNAGSGGLLGYIDMATGKISGNGFGGDGTRYKEHPYTKIKFDQYQLPDWDRALELGLELADKVPGLKYIGWDITYTEEGKWIMVEGNSRPQVYGPQCAGGVGIRKYFVERLGYRPGE
ncbi:MAG: hypothetical protein IKW01_02060 [Firmicutes bacterium]|nr:hypothetical protein [Bacillota bacterium]